MSGSGSRLTMLILSIVVLCLLTTCVVTTVFLFVFGDWENHAWGIQLTLKVMWSICLAVLASWGLTYVTMFGWHFRRPHPSEWPKALMRAWKEGVQPPALFKSAPASFTITVILVSEFGAAFLASLCLWIIGDWSEGYGPLILALKFIWGTWWVLVIATVLVRIAIFAANRKQARPPGNDGGPVPPPDGPRPEGAAPSGDGVDGAKRPAAPAKQGETDGATGKDQNPSEKEISRDTPGSSS